MTTAAPNVILSSVQYSLAQARINHPCQPRRRSLSDMKKIIGLVVLSLFAISASAADLMASSTAPTVTQNIVVEGAACPGVGATGFSSTGLLLSCQSGVWRANSGIGACGRVENVNSGSGSIHSTSTCPAGYAMTGLACRTTDTSGDSVQYDATPRVITDSSVTCSRIGAGSSVIITSTAICCPS